MKGKFLIPVLTVSCMLISIVSMSQKNNWPGKTQKATDLYYSNYFEGQSQKISQNQTLRSDNRKNQLVPVFGNPNPKKGQSNSNPHQPYFAELNIDELPANAGTTIPLDKKVKETEFVDGLAGIESWSMIMSEDFEGTFPTGSWDNYAVSGYTDAYWDQSDCRANNGSYSAWCGQSGTASLDCFDDYSNDMLTYMSYGPFDLTNAEDAYINFYKWLNSEQDYDNLGFYVSTDGSSFYGVYWTGLADYWEQYTFDLTDVYSLGNVCGESEVWFLIEFQSDFSYTEPEGAFIDDVEIWISESSTASNLTLTGGGFSPAPIYMNQSLTIDAEITNEGTVATDNAEVQYYLSEDTYISSADCYLGNDFVSIDAGGMVTETITVALSDLDCISPGSYYVAVFFVDEADGWYWTTPLEIMASQFAEIQVSPTELTVYESNYESEKAFQSIKSKQVENYDEYRQGKLIVKFADEVEVEKASNSTNQESINELLTEFAISKIEHVFAPNGKNEALKQQFGMQSIFYLEFDKSQQVMEIMHAFNAEPNVVYAEPDGVCFPHLVPDDPLYEEQWGLKNTGQAQPWDGGADVGTPGADINAELAWDIQTGSSDVTVAILDEGVDLDHPEFVDRLVPGYDYIDNDDDPNPEGDGAHGTASAGIAAAANDGVGTVGVAWGVMIMPVRVLGEDGGTWTQISNGITFAADEGAHIISMSLGGNSYSSTLETAVNYAYALDILLLASAGNNDSDNGVTPSYPCDYTNCISVGAMSPCNDRKTPTTCDAEDWWGSNYGGSLDFMAPGTRIYTTDISGTAGYSSDNYTATFNGTSAACPFASGIAALIKSQDPSLTNSEIWTIMQNSCVDMEEEGYDNETGYGRVDAYEALLAVTGGATGNEFNIKNVGGEDLTISSISADMTWMTPAGYPATPFVLSPGESQLVTVEIDWTQLTMEETGTVTVSSDDEDEPTVLVSVTAIPVQLPDLIVENQDVNPSSLLPGELTTATSSVTNQGSLLAGESQLNYYLSVNETWQPTDVLLDSDAIPELDPGNSSLTDIDLTIPSDTDPGDYYILFFADADLEVTESDDLNNVSYLAIEVVESYIVVDPLSDDVTSASGSTSVDIESNVSWTVSESCDWLTVSPTSGTNDESITVTYEENMTVDPRSCTITVSDGGAEASYTLNQEGADPYLTLDPVSDDVGAESGNMEVDLMSNVDWTVDESCDWLTVSPGSGNGDDLLTVEFDANLSTDSRTCIVTVSGDDVEATYTLNQAGADPFITVDPVSDDVAPASGSIDVDVMSNIDWTISETCDWLTVTPDNGSGSATITVEFDENSSPDPRTCIVTISGGDTEATYTLNQAGAGPYIMLDPESDDVGAESGSTEVSLMSNVDWTISETCDWLSVAPDNGSGDGSFTVTYDENMSIEPRSCILSVSGEDTDAIYTLNQAGVDPYIVLDPESDDVGANSGSTDVNLSSNVDWSVSESCDWLSVSPDNGSGDGAFTVSFDENMSVEPRSCILTVSGDGAEASYSLEQAGADPFIYIEPEQQDVGYEQGEITIPIESNVSWTVNESCDWLSTDPVSGQNSGTINFMYEENTSTEIRSCTISITGNGETDEIVFNQDGTTSIGDQNAGSIKVYPNPTNGVLTIKLDDVANNQYKIRLIDLMGNVVVQENLSTENNKIVESYNISNLAAGVYSLQIYDATGKIIKQERVIKE